MSTTVDIPKLWAYVDEDYGFVGETEDEYMARALEAEENGARLVVEVWISPYQDYLDGDWEVLWLECLDYRTNEHVFGYDPNESQCPGTSPLFVVKRRAAN